MKLEAGSILLSLSPLFPLTFRALLRGMNQNPTNERKNSRNREGKEPPRHESTEEASTSITDSPSLPPPQPQRKLDPRRIHDHPSVPVTIDLTSLFDKVDDEISNEVGGNDEVRSGEVIRELEP